MSRNIAIGLLVFAALSIAALSGGAQTVRRINSSTMQFIDLEYGVSFLFPASWSFSKAPALGSIDTGGEGLRAVIFRTDFPGIAGWPRTNFVGDEIEYGVQPTASSAECRSQASMPTSIQGGLDERTIRGIVWNHDLSDTGSLGREALEDTYSLYNAQSEKACIVFRLVVHYRNIMPGNSPPLVLSPHALGLAKAAMQQVFSTVRITQSR